LFGVVPVRGFTSGKTRLAEALAMEERASIMQWMLRGVIDAALTADVLDEIAVISPDTSVLAYARSVSDRVTPVLQRRSAPGLNPAVSVGREWAVRGEVHRLLVLFADLPQLTAPDVRAVVSHPADVVVATDRRGLGSNVMLTPVVGAGRNFVFRYGEGSARRHAAEAERLGLSYGEVRRPGTEFDLDTPEDWRDLSITSGVAVGQEREPAQSKASGLVRAMTAAGERR
jgi:2-phospho-L-lactate guanylyltransferase